MATKKCIICGSEVKEEYGKLRGTVLKVLENKKNRPLYVCSDCQKEDNWIEKAKVKGA